MLITCRKECCAQSSLDIHVYPTEGVGLRIEDFEIRFSQEEIERLIREYWDVEEAIIMD